MPMQIAIACDAHLQVNRAVPAVTVIAMAPQGWRFWAVCAECLALMTKFRGFCEVA